MFRSEIPSLNATSSKSPSSGIQCCFGNCPEIATDGPLCSHHFDLKVARSKAKGLAQGTLPLTGPVPTTNSRLVPELGPGTNNQNVLQKKTARKTAPGSSFPSVSFLMAQDAKAKHRSLFPDSQKVNGPSVPLKPPAQGRVGFSPPDSPAGSDGPARKKQRIISSSRKEVTPDRPVSKSLSSHSRRPSATNEVHNSRHDKHEMRGSPSSFITNQLERDANRLPDEKPTTSSTSIARQLENDSNDFTREERTAQDDSHLNLQNGHATTPISIEEPVNGRASPLHAVVEGLQRNASSVNGGSSIWREQGARRQEYSITESESDNVGPRPRPNTAPKGVFGVKRSKQRSASAKTRPYAISKTVSKSLYTDLEPIVRTPPLEQQRQRLAESAQVLEQLDAFIYGQPSASEPPAGVNLPSPELLNPQDRDAPYFAHIDPRTHWTRPHTEAWYEKKEREIKERGGRKANLGKAAERIREQRLKNGHVNLLENLPDRVKGNQAWAAAMHWFDKNNQESLKRDKEAVGKEKQRRRKRAPTVLSPPARI